MLRLTKVLKNQLHLPTGEVAVIDTIARSEQRGQQAVGVVDVAVEATQRIGGRADGEVHRGEFALGVGADEASPLPLPRRGDTDIVGIHDCLVFRVEGLELSFSLKSLLFTL